MKKRMHTLVSLSVILLSVSLLFLGCHKEANITPTGIKFPSAGGTEDIEPTIEFGWTSGESPVPNNRIGMFRAGLNFVIHAVSPTGIYCLDEKAGYDTYVMYADNGSDTFIPLCGRPDCPHTTADCNAYLYAGSALSYYGGYLYAVSGDGPEAKSCRLVRMDPDGTNRITVLDLLEFSKEIGGDFARVVCITEGFCLFNVYRWDETESFDEIHYDAVHIGGYYYMLDGTMERPERANTEGIPMYSCGDVFLTYDNMSVNGGEYGSYRDWDASTNSATFLTDHPGQPGWYGRNEGYYFRDGYICRLTYATQKEEYMVDTGLKGDYYLFCFPDCLVLASNEKNSSDNNLYIYNWSFELLNEVRINNPTSDRTQFMLIAETAERLILTDVAGGKPKYYINKSDLGTNDVKFHEWVYL